MNQNKYFQAKGTITLIPFCLNTVRESCYINPEGNKSA